MIARICIAIALFLGSVIHAKSDETELFYKLERHVEFLERISKQMELDQSPFDNRSAFLAALYDYLRLTYSVSDWLEDDINSYLGSSELWRKAYQAAKWDSADQSRQRALRLIDLSEKIDETEREIDLQKQEMSGISLEVESRTRLCASFGDEICIANGTAKKLNEARTTLVEIEKLIFDMRLDILEDEREARDISQLTGDEADVIRLKAIEEYEAAHPNALLFKRLPVERLERFPLSDDSTLYRWLGEAAAIQERFNIARGSILSLMKTRYNWHSKYITFAKNRVIYAYGINPDDPNFSPSEVFDSVAEYGVELRAADRTIVYEARCEFGFFSETEIINGGYGYIVESCGDSNQRTNYDTRIVEVECPEGVGGSCHIEMSCPELENVPKSCYTKLSDFDSNLEKGMQEVLRLSPFMTQQ